MQRARRVALITGRDMEAPDTETSLVSEALASLGIASETIAWREKRDWGVMPLILLRTPWDYVDNFHDFLAWTTYVASVTRLRNTADVVRWNLHKSYLLELAQHGVPTVPTQMLHCGRQIDANGMLHDLAEQFLTTDIIVKPAIGNNARGAMRAAAHDPVLAQHLTELLEAGDVLVQPFVPTISSLGEVSLIFIGAVYSHAVRKLPRAGDYRVQDNHGGTVHLYTPSAIDIKTAYAALAVAPNKTLYARVDMVHLHGVPVVIELEMIEPELFLRFSPTAAGILAGHLREELDS